MAIKQIPLTDIVDNPFQPRTHFDPEALRSLADEMKAEGFWSGTLQGRRTKNGKIELVFGHRRLRALKLLKTDAVAIELVELTDAQMALRSLEENLQREGLTDLEKADGVKRAVEIAREELRAAGRSDAHAVPQVADRLGLSRPWVSTLCEISVSMPTKIRNDIEAGHLTAQTAFVAKQWGGEEYARTLAQQGKEAKASGDVPKPTHMTVKAMRKVVEEAPEPVREKLKKAIVSGEVSTPAEAAQKGRRLAGEHVKREKVAPPDLKVVIIDWTHRIKEWEQQMKEVAPYMPYVEEVPSIADKFRAALKQFIATAETLLHTAPAGEPKAVGKGRSIGAARG